MIGDPTPLQIPGFDPSVLPAIPGLPGLTPPGNPPSGGGGTAPDPTPWLPPPGSAAPSMYSEAFAEGLYDQLSNGDQAKLYTYVSRAGSGKYVSRAGMAGRQLWLRDIAIAAAVGGAIVWAAGRFLRF